MCYEIEYEEAKKYAEWLNQELIPLIKRVKEGKYKETFDDNQGEPYAYPFWCEEGGNAERIEISFTLCKEDGLSMPESEAYALGEQVEEEIADIFDRTFGDVEEDEFSQEGGWCCADDLEPEAYREYVLSGEEIPILYVDFYWEIKRAVSLDN